MYTIRFDGEILRIDDNVSLFMTRQVWARGDEHNRSVGPYLEFVLESDLREGDNFVPAERLCAIGEFFGTERVFLNMEVDTAYGGNNISMTVRVYGATRNHFNLYESARWL